jgi:8-oxo-dGTP diphosphatase
MVASKLLTPLVSADVALFCVDQGALQVLLVRRARAPAQGEWALPGAVLKPEQDRDLESTALRALRDKLSVEVAHLEQVTAVSGPSRDPRGYSVAVLFYALLPRDRINAAVKSKVETVQWLPVGNPGQTLAFDHDELLAAAVASLRNKVERHALPLHLLPEKFTLTELQRICEAVLGRQLDKGVFRRRLRDSPDLQEVPGELVRGSQRPAQVYRTAEAFRF